MVLPKIDLTASNLPVPNGDPNTVAESVLVKAFKSVIDEFEERHQEQTRQIIEAIFTARVLKGLPVRVFDVPRPTNGISEHAVDCRGYNAVSVSVFVTGTTPSATITVKGSDAEGGNYLQLPDANAQQTTVSADEMFDTVVGSAFVKIELSAISGTFGNGQGYTVIVTPYVRG